MNTSKHTWWPFAGPQRERLLFIRVGACERDRKEKGQIGTRVPARNTGSLKTEEFKNLRSRLFIKVWAELGKPQSRVSSSGLVPAVRRFRA